MSKIDTSTEFRCTDIDLKVEIPSAILRNINFYKAFLGNDLNEKICLDNDI